jgi:glycosyltransferase involved in cell wall biosynthesis
MTAFEQSEVDFQVDYIFNAFSIGRYRLYLFNPCPFFEAAHRIIVAQPDILIVSLWRSCVTALLVKLIIPRIPIVLFLHCPEDVHYFDFLLTRLTAKISFQIWGDSKATLARRLPRFLQHKKKVISFVIHRLPAVTKKTVRPLFLFWGRIHFHKNLERTLKIFSTVYRIRPEARFIVIGPDGGELTRMREVAHRIKITDAVMFAGAMNFSEIKSLAQNASFYLQTSELEGMAMSVVEAMQLGLVPVVTPVGEIGNYCKHRKNSLLVTSDQAVVDDIQELLNNPRMYNQLRRKAIATWAAKPLYAESVVNACLEIYSKSKDGKQVRNA